MTVSQIGSDSSFLKKRIDLYYMVLAFSNEPVPGGNAEYDISSGGFRSQKGSLLREKTFDNRKRLKDVFFLLIQFIQDTAADQFTRTHGVCHMTGLAVFIQHKADRAAPAA